MFIDLILAVSIFIVIVAVAFMAVDLRKLEIQHTDNNFALQTKATVLSDLIVRQQTVFTINSTNYGIVSEPNVFSMDRVNNFSNLSYDTIKSNLALGQMDFYIKLYFGNGTTIKTIGNPPNGTYTSYSTYRVITDKEGDVGYQEMTINGTKYNLCEANLMGFYGKYYNIPANHSDMEGSITGVVKGLVNSTLPIALGPNGSAYINQFDWFNDSAYYNGSSYYSFDRLDSNISFSNVSFFPVNNSWPGDPQYFAVMWSSYIYANQTKNYTYSQSSDDDSWTFIDGKLVVDLGGIHAASAQNGNISLTAGYHDLTIFFADRHKTQSGFSFTIPTGGVTFRPFRVICDYNYTTAIMEMVVWQRA